MEASGNSEVVSSASVTEQTKKMKKRRNVSTDGHFPENLGTESGSSNEDPEYDGV